MIWASRTIGVEISRTSKIVFSIGIALPLLGWFYWMNRVGASWWYAYKDGEPGVLSTGDAAERITLVISVVGGLICASAPFFSRLSIPGKFLFLIFGVVAAIASYFLSAFIVMFGFLGF